MTFLNLFQSNCTELSFLNSLVNIKHLDLAMSDNITNNVLMSISNLTDLRILSLYKCDKLTYDGFQSLKEKLPHLNALDFDFLIDYNSDNN
jgi:hypothetical protein